jgi:hypothetical protein
MDSKRAVKRIDVAFQLLYPAFDIIPVVQTENMDDYKL